MADNDNWREIPPEDFIQRLVDAGWNRPEAEAEWRRIQDETEGDE